MPANYSKTFISESYSTKKGACVFEIVATN